VPTADPPPLLALSGVSRSYGERHALLPINLAVPARRCVAVLGANGSGKSTLLRIAAGRDAPSTGLVRYAGQRITADDPVVRTEIAVVGDMVSAYPDLTVREHLLLVAVAHGAAATPGSWPTGRCGSAAWTITGTRCHRRCPAASSRRCTWPRCWSGRVG
jgi:ABC-2 type transport system ATP-binding protein